MRYKILFITLLAFSAISCEDWLDVNDDPNRTTQAPASEVFTGALVDYSTNRTIDLGPPVSTAGQMWSGGGSFGAGVFTRPEQYIFSIFTTGNTWRAYYRNSIKNLELVISDSEGANNTIAQCKIFEALNYYSATMLWEDVPFTEALDVNFETAEINNLNPRFDDQQDVLNGIVDLLDEAIGLIDDAPNQIFGQSDLIYNGDMDGWRKFAKSLKLRVLMTMAAADNSVHSQIGDLIGEGDLISDPSENAEIPFFEESGNRNPFWETLNAFAGAQNFFFFASEAMVETMKSYNDPRIDFYFEPYPGGGSPAEVVGAPPGVTNIGFTPWVLSTSTDVTTALVQPTAPDVLFTAQESKLIQAEAIVKGFAAGSASDADALLREAITISMSSFGIDQTAIDDHLSNNIPDLSSLTQDEALQVVSEHMFIDCVVRPLEGWTYWRINEYPTLDVPENAQTANLVRRLPYPPDELEANVNAPGNKPLDENMWFDQ